MPTDVFPDELRTRLAAGEELFLLDVREPEEVAELSFPGALNVPLGSLAERAQEVPRDRTVVVICAAGVRSAQAASALEGAGWRTENLVGGTTAWFGTEHS